MWPGGRQPVTDNPWFIVNAPEDRGSKKYQQGGTFSFPMTLSFYCPTHGNSIVYTYEKGTAPHWKLYNGSLHLPIGTTNVRIKAVRYGYTNSEEVQGVFDIK
jgi:hypothetical protein